MLDIVSAIYDMMGRFAEPCIDEHTAREHVERVFMVRGAAALFTTSILCNALSASDSALEERRFKNELITCTQLSDKNILFAKQNPAKLFHMYSFQRMDANKDGVISVEEFMDTCRKVTRADHKDCR